jgi:mannosylglycoprotein endo-beta-mannosidase
MDHKPEIVSMNVRGLNDLVKRDAVHEFISLIKVNMVCLQETKLDAFDSFTFNQCLGPAFDEFCFLPAVETRGGILLAWDSSVVKLGRTSLDSFLLNAEVVGLDNVAWWLTVVYGPQRWEDKVQFLRELSERRRLCAGPWLVIGDFNMILRASEKNNRNLDRRSMNSFREFVAEHELKEIYMHGRLYTWSNEREVPTMSKIDRALVSVDWDLAFPNAMLQALASTISDHAPLHLSLSAGFRPKHRFRFESFWVNLPGFREAVMEAWVCDPAIVDPFHRLDALFRNTAEALQSWGERSVGNVKLKIAIANQIVLRFDVASESRQLSQAERWLRNTMKMTVLGLASLDRTIARQRSRIRWLKEGDANSKLFHVVANGRRMKNFIASVRVGEQIFTDQVDKEAAFFSAYTSLIGEIRCKEHTVDMTALGIEPKHLHDLEVLFSEEEVWRVV